MPGAVWLNAGSLVLGLIAWILPAISLVRRNTADIRKPVVFSVASLSGCATALCLQIFSINLLVTNEDWSALMDISPALVLVAAVLLAVTLILNAIALVVSFRKTPEN